MAGIVRIILLRPASRPLNSVDFFHLTGGVSFFNSTGTSIKYHPAPQVKLRILLRTWYAHVCVGHFGMGGGRGTDISEHVRTLNSALSDLCRPNKGDTQKWSYLLS